MIAATHVPGRRGTRLLLEHCATLAGSEFRRPSAGERLRDLLGDDLARRLVRALALRRGPDFPAAA